MMSWRLIKDMEGFLHIDACSACIMIKGSFFSSPQKLVVVP